jgi:hypothetical protein
VPRLREADDLVLAGDELRHPDRRFVRFRAGAQQQRAIEARRREVGEARRELDDRPRQHPAEQVIELARIFGDDRDDVRWQCPSTALIWPDVKSRIARPSAS